MTPEIAQLLLQFVLVLVAIALHEYGHAKVADLLGDPTPRLNGRLTLNPTEHWDVVGSFIFPLISMSIAMMSAGSMLPLAWGKPVEYDERAIARPPQAKLRELMVVLAGPAVNLLLAFVGALFIGLSARFAPLADLGQMLVLVNCALFVFNFLPIPQFDGSDLVRIVFDLSRETMMRWSMPALIIVLVILNVPGLNMIILAPIGLLMLPFLAGGELLMHLLG